jgi:HD domain-containing protein
VQTVQNVTIMAMGSLAETRDNESGNRDGSGYPEGLAGEAIPLSARLMALADVYDALISKRVYKPSYSHDEAVEMIRQGSGTHFDPEMSARSSRSSPSSRRSRSGTSTFTRLPHNPARGASRRPPCSDSS